MLRNDQKTYMMLILMIYIFKESSHKVYVTNNHTKGDSSKKQ